MSTEISAEGREALAAIKERDGLPMRCQCCSKKLRGALVPICPPCFHELRVDFNTPVLICRKHGRPFDPKRDG